MKGVRKFARITLDPIYSLLKRKPGMTAMQICVELNERYFAIVYRLKQLERREFVRKNIQDDEFGRQRNNRWYAV